MKEGGIASIQRIPDPRSNRQRRRCRTQSRATIGPRSRSIGLPLCWSWRSGSSARRPTGSGGPVNTRCGRPMSCSASRSPASSPGGSAGDRAVGERFRPPTGACSTCWPRRPITGSTFSSSSTVVLGIVNAFVRGYSIYGLFHLPQVGDRAWRRPITQWHGLAANIAPRPRGLPRHGGPGPSLRPARRPRGSHDAGERPAQFDRLARRRGPDESSVTRLRDGAASALAVAGLHSPSSRPDQVKVTKGLRAIASRWASDGATHVQLVRGPESPRRQPRASMDHPSDRRHATACWS